MFVCLVCLPKLSEEEQKDSTPVDARRGKWLTCKLCNRRHRMGIITKREER